MLKTSLGIRSRILNSDVISKPIYEAALKPMPTANIARQRLAYIHENYLNQPEEAEYYKLELSGKIHSGITSVTGLPRLGIFMLVQILENGFCGGQLALGKMATVVDNKLYRIRNGRI